MRTYKLISYPDALKIPDFPQTVEEADKVDEALAYWLDVETGEGDDSDFYGSGADILVELIGGKFSRLIAIDYQPEPEDATLHRSYRWVIDELNKLGALIHDDSTNAIYED